MASVESRSGEWAAWQRQQLWFFALKFTRRRERISFWLPGLEGSLAATPTTPGWSLGTIYYHTSGTRRGRPRRHANFKSERFSPTVNINLNLNLSGRPIYSSSLRLTPRDAAVRRPSVDDFSRRLRQKHRKPRGTLTATAGPIVTTRTGFLEDALTSMEICIRRSN